MMAKKSKGARKHTLPGNRKEWAKGPVRAKKHLGQHFLKDEQIAQSIANTLSFLGYKNILEIGPGTGVMTKYLLQEGFNLIAMEVDPESVVYLRHSFPLDQAKALANAGDFKVIEADFLRADLAEIFGNQPFAIIGNFPYNISTQIVFRLLDFRDQVPEFAGMFQREVAQRICAHEGNKSYGILSVLVQAYYDAEYLFGVSPEVFDPPPKVHSGVLRLRRKPSLVPAQHEALFIRLVKTAFNQRRKTLRNSLKTFQLSESLREGAIFDQRPEQLQVSEFVALAKMIADDTV